MLAADPPIPLAGDPLVTADSPALGAIVAALSTYAATRAPAALEPGFAAARALIAGHPELAEAGAAGAGPSLSALHTFADDVPELGALLDAGARAAGEAVTDATLTWWAALGLGAPPIAWGETEHAAARTVLACACAVPGPTSPEWLPASLRRIAAARIASLLAAELTEGEAVWLRALGDRYGSLRHRCAPRTALRSRGLHDLVRQDPDCRESIRQALERWVAAGGSLGELAVELEAAVVHTRTPARLA